MSRQHDLTSELRWQCRRGMLELDLLLNGFLDERYNQLSDDEKAQFKSLLDYPDQTLFDLLMAETDPRYVFFQMDVLWTVFPGQDPVQLLQKYPNRWLLMHLKDLKKGVPTGSLSGHTELTNDVALGTGQVEWPALLRAAQKIGIKYYFIEDESPSVVKQVPQSLRFLETLKY